MDLKPHNVLLSASAKICDVGFSRILHHSSHVSGLDGRVGTWAVSCALRYAKLPRLLRGCRPRPCWCMALRGVAGKGPQGVGLAGAGSTWLVQRRGLRPLAHVQHCAPGLVSSGLT